MLAASALLLCGCLAAGHAPPVPSVRDPPPGRLELTGCTGWSATTQKVPPALVPGDAPPGWGPSSDPFANVEVAGLECGRVSLGPFERGPVRILFDGHDNAEVPSSCYNRTNTAGDVRVLNSIWVDDEALARDLRDTYGMPAFATNVTQTQRDEGGLRLHTWAWDGGRSTVTASEDGSRVAGGEDSWLFWPLPGGGLGELALAYDKTILAFAPRPAVGQFAPPMLLARMPFGLLTGSADWNEVLAARGTLTLFHDTACQEPA